MLMNNSNLPAISFALEYQSFEESNLEQIDLVREVLI